MDFFERMQTWRSGFTWKKLLIFLLLLPLEVGRRLLEDRFDEKLNKYIDKHSDTTLSHLAQFAKYILTHPVSSTAVFALLILAGILLHAYIDTRPDKRMEEPKETIKKPRGPEIFIAFPLIEMGSKRYLVVQNNGPGLAYNVSLKVPGSTVSTKDIELVRDDKELYAFRSKDGKYISTFDFIMFGAKHLPAFVVLMDGQENWFEYTFVESDSGQAGFKFMGQKYIGKTRPT
jgi:hypothetical protein